MTSAAYSPDGSKIVSYGKGGTIKVWELKTVQKKKKNWWGKTIKAWDAGKPFQCLPVAFLPSPHYPARRFPHFDQGEAECAHERPLWLHFLRSVFS